MKLAKNSRKLLSLLQAGADCSGRIEITLADIASEMGVCVNTVVSATEKLERAGLITVTRGQRSKNAIGKESAGKNIYRLHSEKEGGQ
ncbi:hypothetical protein [Dickeya ananatis]|uniref:hypothetical protein n=1 Tax=Dickeya ananatis TaxID=3061286 RepID=UPI00388DF68C